jgi:hypothetical protein
MKKWLRVTIALIIGVISLLAVFRYANTSRIEWDVSSGRQRTVTIFLGITLNGDPESTRLSEWKGGSSDDAEWVEVASASSVPRGSFVSWCYFNLLQMDLTSIRNRMNISAMGEPLDTKKAKEAVADFILDALRDGTEICDVVDMLRRSPMMEQKRDLMDRPITVSELRSLNHKQNKSALTNPLPL